MSNIIQPKVAFGMLLLLALAACSPSWGAAPPLVPATTSTPRSPYALRTNLNVEGAVVPKDIVELAYDFSGRVLQRNVEIGDQVYVGQPLVQLDTVMLEIDVARAKGALQAAQAQLEYDKLQPYGAQLQAVTAAKITVAQADLDRAQAALQQATLTSPMNGTVVDVQAAPGERVTAGKVVITLANLRNLQVETLDLREDDISHVYVGQPVKIYIRALKLMTEGTVVTLAPQATTLGERRVYTVTIQFKVQPSNLRWGMSADVEFVTDD